MSSPAKWWNSTQHYETDNSTSPDVYFNSISEIKTIFLMTLCMYIFLSYCTLSYIGTSVELSLH